MYTDTAIEIMGWSMGGAIVLVLAAIAFLVAERFTVAGTFSIFASVPMTIVGVTGGNCGVLGDFITFCAVAVFLIVMGITMIVLD